MIGFALNSLSRSSFDIAIVSIPLNVQIPESGKFFETVIRPLPVRHVHSMVRASIAEGSANVRTSWSHRCHQTRRAALRAPDPASADPPTCRDQTQAAAAHRLIARPPAERRAPWRKSLMTLAAAPGSSFANASRIGPLSVSCIHSNSVPSTARRASVFLTTRMYTPALRASLRNSVISATERPLYSAATAVTESPATAFTSLTSCFLVFESQCHELLLAYGYLLHKPDESKLSSAHPSEAPCFLSDGNRRQNSF